jgi:hypothetical protein
VEVIFIENVAPTCRTFAVGITISSTTTRSFWPQARHYQTRGDWKKSAVNMYQIARLRPIWDECVAHMRPAANPFANDYVIYAEEFSDHYCYVGLTLVPENRKAAHACRGPVFEHARETGLKPVFKIIESGLLYSEAGAAEDRWQVKYATDGWQALHTAKAGCLGSIHASKWTREAVMAEALKYQTKQEWIDKSQMSYRIAKREGWFEEASAHMPTRVLGIGAGVPKTPEAKEKMRQAKLGSKQSTATRRKRSASITEWWVRQNATPLGPP